MAGHFADNPASGRVLEKAGFLYTGETRKAWSRARRAAADTRMMDWLASNGNRPACRIGTQAGRHDAPGSAGHSYAWIR